MKQVHKRGQRRPRSRPLGCDDMTADPPDPYGDFPEYIEAMLDGANGPGKR